MSFSECRKRLFDNLVSPLLLLNNILEGNDFRRSDTMLINPYNFIKRAKNIDWSPFFLFK